MTLLSKEFTSPNFDERPSHLPIDMLVLHYTGMPTAKEALLRLCNQEAKVSAHYLINEYGTIYELVPPPYRAWHAGISYWRGKTKLNDISIGIEIVNPGHEFGYVPFPEAQISSVIALCKQLQTDYQFPPFHIVGHSDIAPLRKQDPGELFPWRKLAEEGIGLWHEQEFDVFTTVPLLFPSDQGDAVLTLQKKLFSLGYEVTFNSTFDDVTEAVILAFKRHYCPETLGKYWDSWSEKILNILIEKIKTY